MKIVLAGGGTAGHVEPALAVARVYKERFPTAEIVLVGTPYGIENTLVPASGFTLAHIPKAPFPRRLSIAALVWPLHYLSAIRKSYTLTEGSSLVVGFGGYVSAPIYLAAFMRRIPFFIHEANAIAGLANRFGAFFAQATFVAYNSTREEYRRFKEATVVGIPLRTSIVNAAQLDGHQRAERRIRFLKELQLEDKETILVVGGSTGARSINSVIEDSLHSLLAKNIQVIHIVGVNNELPSAQPGYIPLSYLSEMADAYLASDIVIARGGAVTCVELGALGKHAVVIPLPVGNGEQKFNAEPLRKAGLAEVVDNNLFTRAWLLSNIDSLLKRSKEHVEPLPEFPLNSADLIVDRMAKELKS